VATKEELKERAKELEIEGRSTMSKPELEEAVGQAEGSDEATVGKDSEASDADNPEVVENLSPEGQDALADMGEEAKDEADLALDASGPLHLQSPQERVMTGAVSEEHAKEQESMVEMPEEGHTGNFTEAGELLSTTGSRVDSERGSKKDNLGEGDDRELHEVRQEDVIDFPPPVGERDERKNTDPGIGRIGSVFPQKAQLYTDGISGNAESNLERAYEIPETLQTNNPELREAGDESLSEAAKEEKSDDEKAAAEEAKKDDSE
jgi:hypothetical protein